MSRVVARIVPRFLLIVAVLAACKKDKPEGLPPAADWGGGAVTAQAGSAGPAAPATNPHAGGMPSGANPHAGMDMGAMPTGEGGDPANPHAGMDMGGGGGGGPDVAKMGLPPPDPNRPIDPAHHVRGVIKVHPKAKDRAASGGAVFVVVKRADANGQPSGPPVAVEKLTWNGSELPFELTEAQAMIAGTQLTGDVIVTARYDQDGDAISKQPGDITGQVHVTIPADKVELLLDTVL